jgi:hypothetical protein
MLLSLVSATISATLSVVPPPFTDAQVVYPVAQAPTTAPAADRLPSGPGVSDKATFGVSDERFHSDPHVGWDGFLSGLRGFEHFYEPLGNPLYFESPFNNTSARFLYLHHSFADKSQLAGGDLNVYALQLRVALTERLGFIATKDGYSDLNTGALPDNDGWNAVTAGVKYAFYVDREADMVATGGVRFQINSGEAKVLQDGTFEFSPFVSVAKGWDKFHMIASLTDRIPDGDKGNNVLQWDLHTDYEIAPETLKGFAPFIELHGLHYLSDGSRTGLSVGGLDYTNLGSTDVAGSTVIWFGIGARYKFSPNFSVGADYEHVLTNRNADIFEDRVTVDFIVTW